MKRFTALILTAITLCAILCGCSINGIGGTTIYRYDDADKYTAGGSSVEASISELDIDWISGSVLIEYYQGDKIEFSETSVNDITDELAMHWWVDGETLKIKFAKSGASLIGELGKTLTVEVPYDLAGISITTVSANITTLLITAEEAEFDTVSGTVTSTMSSFKEINADTVSGDIHIQTEPDSDIEINTVSGYVTVMSSIKELSISTVSGNAEVYSYAVEYDAEFDTTSGDIIVHVMERTSLELEFDTVSGDFESDIEMSYKDGKYKRGDKGAKFDVDTVSGNCTVRLYDPSQEEGPIAAPGGPHFGEADEDNAGAGRNG